MDVPSLINQPSASSLMEVSSMEASMEFDQATGFGTDMEMVWQDIGGCLCIDVLHFGHCRVSCLRTCGWHI